MLSKRTTRIFLTALLITGMVIGAYGAGIGTAWLLTNDSVGMGFHRATNAEDVAEFSVFWEAWQLVEDHFYGDLPNTQRLAWGAIRGALDTLDDPYTSFLEPQPRQREKEDLSGRFGGIGTFLSQAEDGSITLDPMEGLPAEQAGVQEGDIVIKVDDTEVTPETTVNDVVTLIRGEIGTIVRLTLRREGLDEPVVVEIERQEIPSPSVEWRMLEEADGGGYIRIMLFSDRTPRELQDAFDELQDQGMTKLILDLRGNGGGMLNSAIDVVSEFLPGGVALYQVSRGEQETSEKVKRGGEFIEGLLVVLVDGGTASASEIVAGALQDRGRAVLIGEKTFGKGSVQSIFDLSDGSSVHITSAQWLTPNRNLISGQGLTPDIEVPTTDEDRSQGRDPQLERAIEHLITEQ
ncbi:MAG: S41 family peptidase [Anaerolineae bacterium]|jgi:carboxyl-terminal processing protease